MSRTLQIAGTLCRSHFVAWGGVGIVLAVSTSLAGGEEVNFLRHVKPILAKHCTKCHGPTKQESGLRLDVAGGVLRGGDSGPAVVANAPDKSRLLQVVKGKDEEVGRMPPKGPGLSASEIRLLSDWVQQGASAPADDKVPARASQHWSFQAPRLAALPAVDRAAWITNPIDTFVLAKLAAADLAPSPPADRATLIRRLSLDLRGLPPTPAEVGLFLSDSQSGAYERLVDRMLASPGYGERWGRHWLDLARYADSNGYTRDFAREIWKYRDWVIEAINGDLPFDQFTIQQYAGDMLPEATEPQRIATGFHRNTLINEEGGTDQEQFRVDAVADRVATTGVVYLGLTLGCARCHVHKYDPVSQREYYQVFAFLNNCDEPQLETPYTWQVERGDLERRREIRESIKGLEEQLEQKRADFEAQQIVWETALTPDFKSKLPGPTQEALMKRLSERDDAQKKLVEDVFKKSDEARRAFPLVDQIEQLRNSEPKIPSTMVLEERGERRSTHIHRRGNFLDEGARVQPGVPSVLHPLPAEVEQPTRLDFARWLVDRDNPLTPRVIVNRFWQRFFGRGIVETENDFGTQGAGPTHPGLLDWLALEFVRQDWSVKAIHRLIVTSSTYRQSSAQRPDLKEADPQNYLLARQTRMRMEAETIRDSALVAAGQLCRTIGGPSVYPPQPDGVFDFTQDQKPWNTERGEDRHRRGMYTYFWRSSPYPALIVFDAPNGNVTCTRRVRSNTPLQALTLANDVQFVECAQALAASVLSRASSGERERAELMFRRCLARGPQPLELSRLVEFVKQQTAVFGANERAAGELFDVPDHPADQLVRNAAWTAAARVLMNLDEFITRE